MKKLCFIQSRFHFQFLLKQNMLQKYLEKKVESLKQNTILSNLLTKAIMKVGSPCQSRIDADNVHLVCSQFLNIASKLLISKNYSQIKEILNIVNSLLLEIHNDEIYELYIIKIRQFLLSLAIAKQNQSQYQEKQKKITFFLQKMQNSQFYALLQEDFYSSLQLIYIEACKMQLAFSNPQDALKSLISAFQALKKQITILTDYANMSCSQKLNNLLQKKRKTLKLVFYLDYGANVSNSDIISDKITEELIPKYQNLFNKILLYFQSKQLISQAIKNLEDPKEQDPNYQDFFDEKQLVQRNSIVSNSSSQESSSKGLQPYLHSALNSINFLEQIDPSKKSKLSIEMPTSLKVSLSDKNLKISLKVLSNTVIHEEQNLPKQNSHFLNQNQNVLNTNVNEQSKFLKEIANMVADEKNSKSKKKQVKQYRTRVFSMVAREQTKENQRVKNLKIEWNQVQKMRVSKGQMLKNGIILI